MRRRSRQVSKVKAQSGSAADVAAQGTVRPLSALWSRLMAPVDIAPLVFLRIAFGAVMLWEVWRYFDKGWIKALFH